MSGPSRTSDTHASNVTPPIQSKSPMSAAKSLTNIFFEPGHTFESLRERPRFLVAALVIVAATTIFNVMAIQRLGYENIIRSSIESNPRLADMGPDQKEQIVQSQSSLGFRALNYGTPILAVVVPITVGAALYLLGVMLAGKAVRYKQSLSVWTYSSLPPILLAMVANVVLLFLTSPDNIDIARSSSGLVHANLGVLVDARASPALATALGTIDLFGFYGLFLAALGLRKVAQLSSGTAWGIIITVWLLLVVIRITMAAIFGTVMA